MPQSLSCMSLRFTPSGKEILNALSVSLGQRASLGPWELRAVWFAVPVMFKIGIREGDPQSFKDPSHPESGWNYFTSSNGCPQRSVCTIPCLAILWGMLKWCWATPGDDSREVGQRRWGPMARSSLILPAPVQAVWPELCGVQEQVCYLRWGAGQGKRSVNSEWSTLGSESSLGWIQAGSGGVRECTIWVVIVKWQAGGKNVYKLRSKEALALDWWEL